MVINSKIMVRSRAPIRYITQSGVVGAWAGVAVTGGGNGGGNGCGSGVSMVSSIGTGAWGTAGVSDGSGGGAPNGSDVSGGVAGSSAEGIAGDAGCGVSGGTGGAGGDSVVKAPTALQALRVSELIAATFQ